MGKAIHAYPPNLSEMVDQYGATAVSQELGIPRTSIITHLKKVHAPDDHDGLSDFPSQQVEEIPVFYRDYSDQPEHRIYPLGDVHIGSPSHASTRWREWLTFVKNTPNVSMLGSGDFLNAALKDSKSEAYDEVMRVGDAKRLLRKQLEPLAEDEKLDLLVPGNHEDRIYRATGDCPIEDIADTLGINYSPAAALIVYQVGDMTYEVALRHGTGTPRSLIALTRQSETLLADVYVSGHTHSQLVTKREIFVHQPELRRLVRRRMTFVSSGSFVGYEKYAAVRGYSPTAIGAPRIRLDGKEHDIRVSV